MTQNQTAYPNRIGRRAGSGPSQNSSYRPPTNLNARKQIVKVSTFNVRNMRPFSQLSELVVSAETHNIDIMCSRTSNLLWWFSAQIPQSRP